MLTYNTENYNAYNYNATSTWRCDHFSSSEVTAEEIKKLICNQTRNEKDVIHVREQI